MQIEDAKCKVDREKFTRRLTFEDLSHAATSA